MKFFAAVLASAVTLASARQIGDYGVASGFSSGSADFSSGSSDFSGLHNSQGSGYASDNDGYGAPVAQQQQQQMCTPVTENEQRDQCESYTERVCTTTYQESCQDVPMQQCTAQVASQGNRKCFDVQDQKCALKEDVRMQTIQVPVTVQKCQKQTERVCDTLYELAAANRNSATQCVNVASPQCSTKQKTLNERVCRTVTNFDCDQSLPVREEPTTPAPQAYAAAPSSGYGYGSGSSSGSSSGFGSGSSSGFGSRASGFESGSDFGQVSTTAGFGEQKANCRRSQETKCTNKPRTVSVQTCAQRQERVCEQLNSSEPSVQARQSCRNEEKRVCELVERQQPKQVKVFSYRKECQNVPRQVCDDASAQSLQPACSQVTRRQCTYAPAERCEDEPKQHCFTVNAPVRRQRCETVTVAAPVVQQKPQQSHGYPALQQAAAPANDGY